MKILRKSAILSTSIGILILSVTACGDLSSLAELLKSEQTEDDKELDDEDEDTDSLSATESEDSHLIELGLSEEARAVLERVRSFLDGLREERDELCGIDGSSHEAFNQQIDAILQDDALTDEEKQAQIEALHDENEGAREEEKVAVDQCLASHEEALVAIQLKAEPVIEACLDQTVEDGHARHRRHERSEEHDDDDMGLSDHEGEAFEEDREETHDEHVAALEAALLSSECSETLDQAVAEQMYE